MRMEKKELSKSLFRRMQIQKNKDDQTYRH